jgi:hypothetical protein
MTLADNLSVLQSSLSGLKAERDEGPLQNDVYEAVDDLCNFGQRAVANDARIDYSTRAKSDLALFQKLRSIVAERSDRDRERYQELLDSAFEFLLQIAQIPLPADGHLGVLKVIRSRFGFLFEQYGFAVCDEQPTGMHLKSGHVRLELGWATASSLSFALTKDGVRHFWLQDLLYLYHDERYEKVPLLLDLQTEGDVESWFEFVACVLEQYGRDLLTDQPESWEQLAQAQSKRDAEYAAMMDARHGRN